MHHHLADCKYYKNDYLNGNFHYIRSKECRITKPRDENEVKMNHNCIKNDLKVGRYGDKRKKIINSCVNHHQEQPSNCKRFFCMTLGTNSYSVTSKNLETFLHKLWLCCLRNSQKREGGIQR